MNQYCRSPLSGLFRSDERGRKSWPEPPPFSCSTNVMGFRKSARSYLVQSIGLARTLLWTSKGPTMHSPHHGCTYEYYPIFTGRIQFVGRRSVQSYCPRTVDTCPRIPRLASSAFQRFEYSFFLVETYGWVGKSRYTRKVNAGKRVRDDTRNSIKRLKLHVRRTKYSIKLVENLRAICLSSSCIASLRRKFKGYI